MYHNKGNVNKTFSNRIESSLEVKKSNNHDCRLMGSTLKSNKIYINNCKELIKISSFYHTISLRPNIYE